VTTFRNRNLRMPDDADMQAELKASYADGVRAALASLTRLGYFCVWLAATAPHLSLIPMADAGAGLGCRQCQAGRLLAPARHPGAHSDYPEEGRHVARREPHRSGGLSGGVLMRSRQERQRRGG
jgi:hypothetical protein